MGKVFLNEKEKKRVVLKASRIGLEKCGDIIVEIERIEKGFIVHLKA
jgi:hypothetical protein